MASQISILCLCIQTLAHVSSPTSNLNMVPLLKALRQLQFLVHIVWPGCLQQYQDLSPARSPPPQPRTTSPPNNLDVPLKFHLVKPVKVLADARKQDQDYFLQMQQVQKLFFSFRILSCHTVTLSHCHTVWKYGFFHDTPPSPEGPWGSWDTSLGCSCRRLSPSFCSAS